jgi:hypothetical protein
MSFVTVSPEVKVTEESVECEACPMAATYVEIFKVGKLLFHHNNVSLDSGPLRRTT